MNCDNCFTVDIFKKNKTYRRYFTLSFHSAHLKKTLSIFCVLATILNDVVIGVNRVNTDFIDYDIYSYKYRKIIYIGLSN